MDNGHNAHVILPGYRTLSRLPGHGTNVRVPWFLVIYLAAITIIGKGPTYLGLPPFYWGELVLALGLYRIAPWALGSGYLSQKRYLTIFIVAFIALGTVLTILSVGRYPLLDVLRDAAIWYYALFFFIGVGLASKALIADRVWRLLRIVWIIALVWNTADILSSHRLSHFGPIIPWRGVPLLFNAIHEAGQNLALGALIVLCTTTLYRHPFVRAVLVLVATAGLAVFAASEGRGMRVGVASAILVLLFLSFGSSRRPYFNERLLTLLAASVPALALAVLMFSGQILQKANLDRFEAADPANPEGTANWRMLWWQNLYNHVMETSPVFGIGFGESLHIYNPLLEGVEDEFVVRSPHNFNMTVFTRMGFAGLFLWTTILLLGIGGLCGAVWRGTIGGRPYSQERRDELAFWVAMLVCTVVNSSFGVLMEGPVLGIWFWFALGFANGRSLTVGNSVQNARQYLAQVYLRYRLAAQLAATR